MDFRVIVIYIDICLRMQLKLKLYNQLVTSIWLLKALHKYKAPADMLKAITVQYVYFASLCEAVTICSSPSACRQEKVLFSYYAFYLVA